MDRSILIKNLNNVFCDINKTGKRYSEVWLSDVDFGDLYQSDKYILNVKADHTIDSCNEEIREILQVLDKKAHNELEFIWSVSIYDSNETIHCMSAELMVYNKASACS